MVLLIIRHKKSAKPCSNYTPTYEDKLQSHNESLFLSSIYIISIFVLDIHNLLKEINTYLVDNSVDNPAFYMITYFSVGKQRNNIL